MKVLIVGGVAGGMSCAARIRRLDDDAEITVFEKGREVSFANCGMPYHISGVIKARQNLLLHTPSSLARRYNLDVRVQHEVISIDRKARTVKVRNLAAGVVEEFKYDKLVLSPGAPSFVPPVKGVDTTRVFVLNTLQDMDSIRKAAEEGKSVCLVGAGFIGLELAENLQHLGLRVELVEKAPHVLPPLDREMAELVAEELRANGVNLHLGTSLKEIDGKRLVLESGEELEADFVVFAIGVLPASELAAEAGLELGERRHIVVDEHMRTSDPDIYAVGDAVTTRDLVTGDRISAPLAGPANRQGRIAADSICGLDSTYRSTQGTAIIKVFNLASASTGLNERWARQKQVAYRRVYLHPMQHASYYPGARPLSIKLLFTPEGKIIGAQAVGGEGVDSLINVLATAMRSGMNVTDLEHLELAYSPQWGSAKHPVNMIGFAAANVLRRSVELTEPDAIPEGSLLLDCRTRDEHEAGAIPGSVLIPVDELRGREQELPKDRDIVIYCAQGLRGYVAYRHLKQLGFKVTNMNGGYRTWRAFFPEDMKRSYSFAPAAVRNQAPAQLRPAEKPALAPVDLQIDACGLQCPGPIVKVKAAMDGLSDGKRLRVTATDPGFLADIRAWARSTGNTILELRSDSGGCYVAEIQKKAVTPPLAAQASGSGPKATTIIAFSNDLDRALAAFIIATGAAAMGQKVTVFFTFWGLNILRKGNSPAVRKSLIDRMFGFMMPRGPEKLVLSKMHMAGMGTGMMKAVMKNKHVMSLPELIESARHSGVRIVACAMSMDIMGIQKEELIDGIEIGGVAEYLANASEAQTNLFI